MPPPRAFPETRVDVKESPGRQELSAMVQLVAARKPALKTPPPNPPPPEFPINWQPAISTVPDMAASAPPKTGIGPFPPPNSGDDCPPTPLFIAITVLVIANDPDAE